MIYCSRLKSVVRVLAMISIAACFHAVAAQEQKPSASEEAVQKQTQTLPSDSPEFKRSLQSYLEEYFAGKFKGKIQVSYSLLRRVPTVSGVSDPKYYAWAEVTGDGKTVSAGAARIAEYDTANFGITDFVSREDIASGKAKIEDIFPAALCADIRKRALKNEETK